MPKTVLTKILGLLKNIASIEEEIDTDFFSVGST